jgi:Flp pilus assembly pilin Flp
METNETMIEIKDARKNEKGVTTVEYAVMLVLVAIAVATAAPNISNAVTTVFQNAINALAG